MLISFSLVKRVSESIKDPTTCINAFFRAFCDASSTVEPKPLVITVFTLQFEAIKLLLKLLIGKTKFSNPEELLKFADKLRKLFPVSTECKFRTEDH